MRIFFRTSPAIFGLLVFPFFLDVEQLELLLNCSIYVILMSYVLKPPQPDSWRMSLVQARAADILV